MSDELDQPEEEGMELVMPFVTVASKGGPHDDTSYACGWQCGAIDAHLRLMAEVGGIHYRATVHVPNLPQLDLIAMKHGFRMTKRATDEMPGWNDAVAEAWALVDFRLAAYLDAEEAQ